MALAQPHGAAELPLPSAYVAFMDVNVEANTVNYGMLGDGDLVYKPLTD